MAGLRITGGALRGRVLAGRPPVGVRPTSSRVREALFSMVGQQLQGWSVLDAFGGTGLLAFEAASRGAGPVTVVDLNRDNVRRIEAEARNLGLAGVVKVRCDEAEQVLRSGVWDLVLLDPPYAQDPAFWVERAAPISLRVLVIEHRAGERLPEVSGPMALDRTRTYGDSALAIYRTRRLTADEESTVVVEDEAVVEGDG